MAYQVPTQCEMTRVIRKLQMVMDETTWWLAATETYHGKRTRHARRPSTHVRTHARRPRTHVRKHARRPRTHVRKHARRPRTHVRTQARRPRTHVRTKLVTIHRCIAILGPAIHVSYRDLSIAILNLISVTWLLALFCPLCCPHTAWIVLCIFYCAIQGHFWLIVPFFFRSLH